MRSEFGIRKTRKRVGKLRFHYPRALRTAAAASATASASANRRRSAAFTIFLFRLALDAEPRVRQRVQTIEADLLAALLALAEALGRLVQPAQRFVHVPQVAAFLRREQECFLPLHRVGALVG